MGLLKYTIIKKRKQYDDYCDILEELVNNSKADPDEIELLDLLIKKWDSEHNSFNDLDPVTLIKALMEENKLKAKDLVVILDLSKGSISKILNYHKGLSKETIRKLSAYFSVSQESFNRSYNLVNQRNKQFEMAGSWSLDTSR